MDKGGWGVSRFSVENFCLAVPKFSVGGILYCSIDFGYRKNLCFRRLCHIFRFSVDFFCRTVPKKFVREPFCAVFQKISGSEKVCGEEGGEYQDFLSKTFCLTVPKISVGEPFRVSLISGIEKVWIKGVGEYQGFPSKNFCLTVLKISVGEPFRVSLFSGTGKVYE